MFFRRWQAAIERRLAFVPAVVLVGARQIGKTTLALQVAKERESLYLDLESQSDRAKLSEAELYLERHEDRLVILDEIQRVPQIFETLRVLIDRGRQRGIRTGRFLLVGSASLELLQQSSESLTGRVSYVEMTPFDLLETASMPVDLETLWVRGGFPDSLLARSDVQSAQWRRDFIKTYLERDIPLLGPRIPAETLRRFWTMLAHNQGALFNASKLAAGLGVDGKTVAKYLDLLVDLLVVQRLQPWRKTVGKRLVKSPKIYVRDSGICHALLGLTNLEDVLSHPVAGASWEGFIIANLMAAAPDDAQFSFYRTHAGATTDLVVEAPSGKVVAIEIKRTLAPKTTKGFRNAVADVAADKGYIVYAGSDRFPLDDHLEAIGVGEMLSELAALS